MAERRLLRRSRRALSLLVVMTFAVLSVATSAPFSYVRGEVSVQQPNGEPSAGALVFVLVPDAPKQARLSTHRLQVDDDGEGQWPVLYESTHPSGDRDLDQTLVVAWAPGRGADLERLMLDSELEREQRYRVLLLGHTYFVARSRFVLTTTGHAPPLEVDATGLRVPPAPFARLLVFARAEGPPHVQRLEASAEAQQVDVPAGFVGEVFAVWGGDRLAPRLTTPVAVAAPREGAR